MDTKEELLDYINRKEMTGALLLTGQWGCGKSYIVKEVAKELNDSKKAAVARISLFGLDSVAAINKRVKDEYTGFLLSTMGKTTPKVAKAVTKVIKDGLHVASIAANSAPGLTAASQGLSSILDYDLLGIINVSNTVGKGENTRDFVLIFDDLERSSVETKNLLGVLNEYVENKHIKLIIVADEDHIKKEDYKEYKEKLISRTIKMSVNFEKLVVHIIKEYSETAKGYKDFLNGNIDLLKQVFYESKSNNLRTFKVILADFERVYSTWVVDDKVPTDNMKWVLYTFASEMFVSKEPIEKTFENAQKTSTANYTQRKEKRFIHKGKNESSFYSLFNWIYKGVWDKSFFESELKDKYVEKANTPLQRFLLYSIWMLEQKDIEEGLPAALDLAYAGNLSSGDLLSLLSKTHLLKEHSIVFPCEVNYQKIEDGFRLRMEGIKQGRIGEKRCNRFLMIDQYDEEASHLYKMIERMRDLIAAWDNRRIFIGYLCGQSSSNDSFRSGLCIDVFDDKLLEIFKEQYSCACNAEKYEYSSALMSLSFNSNSYSSEEDIAQSQTNFTSLVEWLGSLDDSDMVTKMINQSLIQEINKSEIMNLSH